MRPAEIEIAGAMRERFAKGLRSLNNDEHVAALMAASIPAPGLAVEIGVEEVFVQTPGPGAGARIARRPMRSRDATPGCLRSSGLRWTTACPP